jgi:hypothetical protein
MTASYIGRALVVGGRVRSKARRALVKMWGVHCRESGLGVFLFAFRVSFSVQIGAGRSFRRASCRRGRRVRVRLPLCSSAARRGRLLAPSRPPINRSFFRCVRVVSLAESVLCRWPLATRAKGG